MSQPTSETKLGIVGGGTIGCGLARVAAAEMEVVLWARSDASLARAERKLADFPAARATQTRDDLAGCGIIVEAIAEERGHKTALYESLAPVLGDQALLATTTSALGVNDLAAASGCAERFAALHVFNPVEKMALVELAFPDAASQATRDRFRALCDTLGKTAIEVPDLPGFVVNRLLFPFAFDAVRVLEETGLEPADIDSCMKLGAAHPLGPLALLDFVGLDVSTAIGETLGVSIPQRVTDLIAAGRLGRKAGAGFYDYD